MTVMLQLWNPGVVAFLLALAGRAGVPAPVPAPPPGGGRVAEAPAPAAGPGLATAPQGAARDTTFRHATHEGIACLTCHRRVASGGLIETRVGRDCRGCHHGDTPTASDCARCHSPAALAPVRRLATPVALTVWPAPRTRTLGFSHERHGGLECAACHAPTRDRTLEKDCASCHADHHEAGRDCASCHASVRETHTRELHATGCGTSGCHVRETTAAVTPVRSTCLACHAEQKDHKAGRECASCHLSRWSVPGTAGRR